MCTVAPVTAEYDWFSLDVRVEIACCQQNSPKSNRFATSVENNATGDLKLSESPDSGNFKEHDLPKRIHKVYACTLKDPERQCRSV